MAEWPTAWWCSVCGAQRRHQPALLHRKMGGSFGSLCDNAEMIECHLLPHDLPLDQLADLLRDAGLVVAQVDPRALLDPEGARWMPGAVGPVLVLIRPGDDHDA